MSSRRLAWLLGLVLLAGGGPLARAEQHALLIGVSSYPALEASLQLPGPANDVRQMRSALQARGFRPERVQVLADGVDGSAALPTRAAILDAMAALARQARPGDSVVIHFSGHGSQQPASDARHEADGWRETFLPRDIGRWDGRRGTVENAITDEVLREAIDRISDTGAFVWAIFDACHSGTLVRGEGAGGPAVRQVAPALLGITAPVPPPARRTAGEAATAPRPGAPARGRAVYFYAAQSGENASNVELPKGGGPALQQGLFTQTLARAIASGQPATYRQLGQYVLARYASVLEARSTPLFTGDGLDEPVLGQRTRVHRQWLLENDGGRLGLRAGSLDGLAPGAIFMLLRDPLAGDTAADAALGYLRAVAVDADRSELQPLAWQGRPAPAASALAAGTYVRLHSSPPSFALRVAVDPPDCRSNCTVQDAAAQLRRDGLPGVDVRWVGASEAPDVVLQPRGASLRYRLRDESAAEPALGWALPPPGEAGTRQARERIAGDLHALARARNLMQLASDVALRSTHARLETTLQRSAQGARAALPLRPDQVATLRGGDTLALRVSHPGGARPAVDLTLLLLDADRGISVLYPADHGESNRLEPAGVLEIADMTINTRTAGTEYLLLIWAEARKHRERRDFGFLMQSPLERVRGDADAELQALIDACFADQLTRGDGTPAPPADGLGMQLFTFRVQR